jgi:hypothetical protein
MRPLFLLLRLLASRENTVYDKTFEMNQILQVWRHDFAGRDVNGGLGMLGFSVFRS